MSIDLMTPRYKVIADYPSSPFKDGEVLFVHINKPYYGDNVVMAKQDYDGFSSKWLDLSEVTKYPHLFKKLEWWEDRKPEDMPEFLKWENCNLNSLVFGKISGYETNKWGELYGLTDATESGKIFVRGGVQPASIEEYNAWLNKEQI